MDSYKMPMIGEKAPAFKATTTYGPVSFPGDYKGKWVVFFSHPGDLPPAYLKTKLKPSCKNFPFVLYLSKDEQAVKNPRLLESLWND